MQTNVSLTVYLQLSCIYILWDDANGNSFKESVGSEFDQIDKWIEKAATWSIWSDSSERVGSLLCTYQTLQKVETDTYVCIIILKR